MVYLIIQVIQLSNNFSVFEEYPFFTRPLNVIPVSKETDQSRFLFDVAFIFLTSPGSEMGAC